MEHKARSPFLAAKGALGGNALHKMQHFLQPESIPLPGAKRSGIYLLPGFQRDPRVSVTRRRTDQRTFSGSSGDW